MATRSEPVAHGPRRNRVDPWGDLFADPARGLFTGNRGCVVDDQERVVRHHGSTLWLICVTEFRGWRWPLARPRRWTPLFFLDDAVALAAGHRPCATCRRDAYRSYRDAVAASGRLGDARVDAAALNRALHAERHERGRGLDRATDRKLWRAPCGGLPDGTVVLDEGDLRLVAGDRWWRFGFDGWHDPQRRPAHSVVDVLTPPTSVAALRHGFSPVLHPSVDRSFAQR